MGEPGTITAGLAVDLLEPAKSRSDDPVNGALNARGAFGRLSPLDGVDVSARRVALTPYPILRGTAALTNFHPALSQSILHPFQLKPGMSFPPIFVEFA